MAETKSKTETKTAAQKSDDAARERMTTPTRNPAAPKDESETTQPDDEVTGVDMRTENPREPVPNALPDAQPKTIAAGALSPETPGSVGPLAASSAAGGTAEPLAVTTAREREEAINRVEMRKVILKRDYWPLDGSGRLKGVHVDDATEADAVELPIEEARFLEESGIAQAIETFPFRAK